LVARLGQKLSVFMFSHFLSAFFYDTAQWFTPFSVFLSNETKKVLIARLQV